MAYKEFLECKQLLSVPTGIENIPELSKHLFDFQKAIVQWALHRGRACVFSGCGTGKTIMELAWAEQVAKYTNKPVLILAPLAVSHQTVREGQKFDINVNPCRDQSDIIDGINICNYEMLHHFDTSVFDAVVLDESGILKSFTGKYRTEIIEAFAYTPFKLACTATPAPNDFMELGNHAEFMGAMTRTEMLSMFFVHDGGEISQWRLKGHAEDAFWKWVASWAVCMRKPSDIGFNDDGFLLPPLKMNEHVLKAQASEGKLFAMEALTLVDQRAARKASMDDRVKKLAELINNSKESWLVWCDYNEEGDLLEKAIIDSMQVAGSDTDEHKESVAIWFTGGSCGGLICGKDRKNINGITTCEITKNGLNSLTNTETNTKTSEKSDVENGITQTKKRSKNTTNETESGGVSGQENNIKQIPNLEPKQSLDLSNNMPLDSVVPIISKQAMELPLKNTKTCLPDKAVDAKYAKQTELKDETFDSMLTIATTQELSEDFSVPTAIWELENSKIAQNCLNKRQCTCGNRRRVLVSKARIFGWGLNFQHCANVAFCGVSHSFESFYQSIRRCYRFGQKNEVNVHIFTSDAELAVLKNLYRKEADAERLAIGMIKHMQLFTKENLGQMTRDVAEYKESAVTGNGWTAYLGDCVEQTGKIASDSIHYSIFSPPFASLYTFSNSSRDMSNSKNRDEFAKHFKFLVDELYRVLMPGRLLSFHCMNLPTSLQSNGIIGISDFRGELIRMFVESGFIYHSEVTIWKDPVTAMHRTHAIGLLHKQLKKDSCMSRQGIPDYLVTMRKPGANPEPVTHTNDNFPVEVWRQYASPVWMDINPSDTLQKESVREAADERHISPLQLQVIERSVELWTNPGDLVLSPFMGIGSEGYVSLKHGRKFVGIELKESYFKQAIANLESAAEHKTQLSLFDTIPSMIK